MHGWIVSVVYLMYDVVSSSFNKSGKNMYVMSSVIGWFVVEIKIIAVR